MRTNDLGRGVVFRIADNGDPTSVTRNSVAFGNRVCRVIGAFRLDVWLDLADERANVRLVEDHDGIDGRKSCEDFCALALGHDWTGVALERSHRIIGVYGDNKFSAEIFGRLQVTDVADMQEIEASVGERDAFTCALPIRGA